MIRNSNNAVKLGDYVESIWRHRGKILAFNAAVVLLTIAAVLFWPREYRSEAKMWIRIGRENSRLDPTASTGKTISIQENDREDEIKSVLDVIGSRGVVAGAVNQLGAKVVLGDEPLPDAPASKKPAALVTWAKGFIGGAVKQLKQIDPVSDEEEAVQEIMEHLVVGAERKSNVISMQYDAKSPHLAQAVVDALVTQYKSTHASIHTTTGTESFFDEQIKTLKDRIDSTSEQLRIEKDKLGLASVEGHRQLLEAQLQDVAASRLDTIRKLAEANAKAEELARQLASQPEQIESGERTMPNTGRDSIRDQLYALQVQRMELETSLSEGNPKLEAIRRQEEKARRSLAEETTKDRKEVTRSINLIHRDIALNLAQVQASVDGFEAMLLALETQKSEIAKKIEALNRSEVGIEQLKRNVALAVTNYMAYSEDLEDARVDQALNANAFSNVSIAQAPTLEEKPVSPSKALVAALGLAAMLFGSIAIAAGTLVMDNSVRRQRDVVELLETPMVVSIPNRRSYRRVLK